MNSLSRTEFRTVTDRQAQARLERMLANRRAAERAREERFRKLPTPQQPEPVNFCAADDDVPLTLTARQLIDRGTVSTARVICWFFLASPAHRTGHRVI